MAKITKIYDDAARTNQVYPQTHEKAVIDNNGATLESKIGQIVDLVNQKQMTIGAVPSDITPTKNSTNWVTSGGVYDTLYNVTTIALGNELTSCGGAINTSTGKWMSSSNYFGALISVAPYRGKTIIIKATASNYTNYTFTVNGYANDTAVEYASGYSTVKPLSIGGSVELEVPSDAAYLYINMQSGYGTDRRPDSVSLKESNFVNKIDTALDAESGNPVENKIVAGSLEVLSSNVDVSLGDYSVLKNGTYGTVSTIKHAYVRVVPGEIYFIKATDSYASVYAFTTEHSPSSGQSISLVSDYRVASINIGEKAVVTIPTGCNYLLVYNGNNSRPFSVKKLGATNTIGNSSITPKLTYDYIGGTTGDFSINDDRGTSGLWCSTPRFVKTSHFASIKVDRACSCQTYFYDASKTFLAFKVQSLTAATETQITQPDSTYAFIKISLKQESNAYSLINATLTGKFDKDWDTFNNRTSNGFHPISCVVNVTKPDSCNVETQTVQDEFTPLADFGLIALPTTYKEDGEPTRLIIYCHGAGTHFARYASSFDTNTHVDPTYWLKEGYAVMDIDGNPYDDVTAHAFIPQAMDCYVEGYKWAIEHYNIKRDGVFLGGRSMGGGNTLNLIRMQCPIPVIAACANLPTSLAMNKNAATKSFGATHRGFILPDGFSWSTGTDAVPYNATERQVVIDNWDKFITWQPITALITDFPTDAEWKDVFLQSCSLNNSDRITIMKDLHAVVKCPLKMFSCNQDPNNTLATAAGLYKKIFANSGQVAELRVFDSFKDYTGTSYTAHYYELQDPTLRTTVTTIYGEEVSNVPMVYVEMLQFWRRYEQR